MKYPIIAIDIDDVISAQVEGLINYSNQRWGHQLTEKDYDEDLSAMWGVPMDEALERITEYLASGGHGRLRHYPEALPVLQKLAKRFDLVLVTSRRERELQAETKDWLQRFFPDLFRHVIFAGIWDDSGIHDAKDRVQRTKAGHLQELGASYFIDDQPKHCFGAAELGIPSILFGDYPWNRNTGQLPKEIVRAKNWVEVEEYFDAQG